MKFMTICELLPLNNFQQCRKQWSTFETARKTQIHHLCQKTFHCAVLEVWHHCVKFVPWQCVTQVRPTKQAPLLSTSLLLGCASPHFQLFPTLFSHSAFLIFNLPSPFSWHCGIFFPYHHFSAASFNLQQTTLHTGSSTWQLDKTDVRKVLNFSTQKFSNAM